MNPALRLERVVVQDFRNLAELAITPGRRVTVVSGGNGHGKTSLLEAIYFAATSKSFRTARLSEVVRHEARAASVRARFREGTAALGREQWARVDEGRRALQVDGKRPPSLASYAVRSPVVCFHAGELELSSGGASARRTILDRVALFLEPQSADHRERYRKAIRARQRALSQRGVGAQDVPPFERLCAVHGAALTRARARAAEALGVELSGVFGRLAAPGLVLDASYEPGGSADAEEAEGALEARREKDRVRGAPGFGPHRDDLRLLLSGHAARAVASQGQHRAITLAIKLSELGAISRARGVFPLLLLDDVSSELDRDRTRALLRVLAEGDGQIFITTTRPELIETEAIPPSDRLDLTLESGAVGGRLEGPGLAPGGPPGRGAREGAFRALRASRTIAISGQEMTRRTLAKCPRIA